MPDWLVTILENLLVMVLTIVFLVGGIYLLLLFLHAWLRFKSGSREAEGLANLWQENQIQPMAQKKENDLDKTP